MLQVLWLTSWYPNKFDAYNGDFIKRHAEATAPFCKLTVIHVQLVPAKFQHSLVVVKKIQQPHFLETIIYLKQSNFAKPVNKIIDQFNYEKYFKKAIKTYITKSNIPQLVHVHVPVKAGKLAVWLKQQFKVPYLLTEHYGIYNAVALGKFSSRSWWFKYLTKKVVSEAALFLPVSKNLGNAVATMVTAKKYSVVYNVVDTNIFNFLPQKNNDGFFWLAHVSIMNHPKNPEGLLRAFAKAYQYNPLLKLRMIGSANNALIAYANELRLRDCVVFTGMLPQTAVATFLKQSDAFILFSNYENMPCAIAEALCCGLPIIATNVGGIPEIITKQNGVLVNAGDEVALAKNIQLVYENYKHYSPEAIASTACETFCYKTIGTQIATLYKACNQ